MHIRKRQEHSYLIALLPLGESGLLSFYCSPLKQHLFIKFRIGLLRGNVVKMKLFFNVLAVTLFLLDHGVSGVYTDRVSVSVKEGDSVTLHTGVQTNQQDDIKWYFSGTRIAQISGDLSDICTDVQCNEGTERFRDRLKLDHQTGSLTITDTRTTDSGLYKLVVLSSSDSEMIFGVSVTGVSAAERDEMKEGESVTLDPGVTKHPNDVMTWFFNEILIAEITGDQSKICTDDECDERFRDRLQLDHQTGSLTITDTRTTDSGLYHLQINSSSSSFSFRRVKSFSVSVTGSGLSSAAAAGRCIAVVVLLVAAAVTAAVVYCRRRRYRQAAQNKNDDDPKEIPLSYGMSLNQTQAEASN